MLEPTPPPSFNLDEARARFAATWSTFCAAPRMLGPTPGHRQEWAAGRTRYAVWGIRVRAEAVRERASALQGMLGPNIRKIPLEDLHITVWVAGFPTAAALVHSDDIPEAALEEQAAALQAHRSFRLVVGGSNSFRTAPFLEVFDLDGGLASLRQTLGRCGPPELRFAPYQPHITLGSASTDIPTASVRRVLSAHRELPVIELTVRCIEQLRFDALEPRAVLQTHNMVTLR